MTDEVQKGRALSRPRMFVALGAGVVTGLVVGLLDAWHYAVIAGWAGACIVYIVWVWAKVWRLDGEQTRSHATLEDPGRRVSDWILLAASVASVVAVVYIVVDARQLKGAPQLLVALLAVLSVGLSWALVHTVYTLRYARMYYRKDGGIDFNQKEPPRYSDFAYLAFTLGMTFQVSDTNISSSYIRMAILRHTLLSYLFGSVILATTVNLVAGLT
ncbi:DUF1345 domain-containing protein [Leifsonia aquatica]|uniref:DUF1345 domain-containing protein n=1 Tax=Leifsonia aquatica TaxID=144185 RepID=UPI00384BE02E